MTPHTIALLSALAMPNPDGPPTSGVEGEVRGVDLFVEACRWQGSNPTLIRTGRARFERTLTTTASEEAIRREVERAVANQREMIKNESDPQTRKTMEAVLANLPEAVRAHHAGQRKSRIEVLFDGNDRTTGKRRFEVVNFDPVAQRWAAPIVGISRDSTREGGDTLVWYDSGSLAKFTRENHGVVDIQWFGRMQGAPSMVATASFLKGRDIARFDFSPEAIAEFKAGIAQLVDGGQSIFQVTREVEYDSGASAYEVESRLRPPSADESRPSQRYWIDPSRGYVCPLIQLHDGEGRLVHEWTSSDYFLHEESGVWFPAVHVRTVFAPETGAVSEREEFRFDRSTVQFNQVIADEEFSVGVPAGAQILDARTEPQRHYAATGPMSLTFVPPGQDLDGVPGLRPAVFATVPAPQTGGRSTVLALNAGILAFIGAVLGWRHWRRRVAAAALVLGCSIAAGCTPATGDAVAGSAAPALAFEPPVLDFGRVRESDEPLDLEFTLTNRGAAPVEIADVRTGCGCTVARPDSATVRPGQAVRVPVTVKTRGRRGPFANSIYVQPAGGAERIEVPIRGTIVDDIWTNGQVVRCSAAADSPTATGLFDLSTVDWPDLEFDWEEAGPGVTVEERSRSTASGETVIRFRFTVEVPRDARAVERSISVRPKDPRVRPLTVPVVAYRDRPEGAGDDAEVLKPARISLGAIPPGEASRFLIFGDPTILKSLDLEGAEGLPDGLTAELSPVGAEDRWRVVVLRVDPSAPPGLFQGRVRFRTTEGRTHSVAVLGRVRARS